MIIMEKKPNMTPSTSPSPANTPSVEEPKVATVNDSASTPSSHPSVTKPSNADEFFAAFSAERKARQAL